MSDLVPSLISCSLYIIIPASVVGATLYGVHRMRKGMKAEIADDECVSCGERSLTSLGPNAYRCNACGYEGGSGLKAIQEAAHHARIDALSPQERRASGLRDLQEARDLLVAAQATFVSARHSAAMDVIGFGGDRGQTKQAELVRAMGDAQRAHKAITDANRKLGDLHLGDGADVDMTGLDFATDIGMDNLVSNMMVHSKIEQASQRVDDLLQRVEASLLRLKTARS